MGWLELLPMLKRLLPLLTRVAPALETFVALRATSGKEAEAAITRTAADLKTEFATTAQAVHSLQLSLAKQAEDIRSLTEEVHQLNTAATEQDTPHGSHRISGRFPHPLASHLCPCGYPHACALRYPSAGDLPPPLAMQTHPIMGFKQDDKDDWIAELACGHAQHVRHNPPWQLRPWVISEDGRASMLGYKLRCAACGNEA